MQNARGASPAQTEPTPGPPEVRAAGGAIVAVDSANPAASATTIAELFEQAARLGLRLELVVEPRR